MTPRLHHAPNSETGAVRAKPTRNQLVRFLILERLEASVINAINIEQMMFESAACVVDKSGPEIPPLYMSITPSRVKFFCSDASLTVFGFFTALYVIICQARLDSMTLFYACKSVDLLPTWPQL